MNQKLKHWLGNTSAFAVSLSVLLVMLEIGLRIFVPRTTPLTVPDAYISRKLRPNMEMDLKGPDWQSHIRTNEYGWMGPSFSMTKPARTQRILHIGDSFTEAIHVDTEKNFVSQLNGKLPGTENLNLSVAGRGTLLELLTYRHYGKTYDPDLTVIWVYGGNDFRDNYQTRLQITGDTVHGASVMPNKLGGIKAFVLQHFYLPRFVFEHGKKNKWFLGALVHTGFLAIEPEEAGAEIPLGYLTTILDSPERAESFIVTKKMLSLLKQEVDKGKLVIGFIPSFAVVKDRKEATKELIELYPTLEGQPFDFDAPRAFMTETTAELGIPFFDLTDPFRATVHDGEYPYLLNDGHLNQLGHDIVAEEFGVWLRNNHLLDR